ncbi:HSP20-like chaperone [Scleroderma yunnanense]
MALTRFYYDPFTEFDRLFDDALISRFRPSTALTDFPSRATSRVDTVFRPRLDLQENPETNTVTAKFELPGLNSEDVCVDVQNDRLTISGEATVSETRDEENYVVRERSYGKFSRTLPLSPGTKHDDVKAKMENGVLTVTFPKASPEQQPKRIAIS